MGWPPDTAARFHRARRGHAVERAAQRARRQVNVEIMRTFVRLREILSSNVDLARKLATLERKYDAQFKAVFDAIRALMAAPATTKRKIGFRSE